MRDRTWTKAGLTNCVVAQIVRSAIIQIHNIDAFSYQCEFENQIVLVCIKYLKSLCNYRHYPTAIHSDFSSTYSHQSGCILNLDRDSSPVLLVDRPARATGNPTLDIRHMLPYGRRHKYCAALQFNSASTWRKTNLFNLYHEIFHVFAESQAWRQTNL